MIDTDNLRTASLYINNQLVSRGLLRDDQTINFADPAKGSRNGDASATMGRIISVVNDLILRRDRDAESRESLSTTMRALRADNLKLTEDNARLQEKNIETQRKLNIAESAEASLRTQLKSADAVTRGLKEDVARHRAAVAQARSSCSNEVRRRDLQIEGLKKQLGEAGRARGTRGNPAVTVISVTREFRSEGSTRGSSATLAKKGAPTTAASAAAVSLGDEEYTLRSETNAFLAKLAGELSEENESMVAVMRRTVERLRDMSGWTGDGDDVHNADPQVVKQAGWEALASDVDSVLNHMKVILTNPSFVPIEEVMVRDEEITRLRTGWVKMEERWKEAVVLIEGWRQRMAANGRPIDDEEFKMGLRLSPVRVRSVRETAQAPPIFDLSAVAEEDEEMEDSHVEMESDEAAAQHEPRRTSPSPLAREESLELVPAPETAQEKNKPHHEPRARYDENGFYEDDDEIDDDDDNDEDTWQRDLAGEADEEPNVEILATSNGAWEESGHSSPLPEPPQLSPLRQSPSAGNRRVANHHYHHQHNDNNNNKKKIRIEPGDFTPITEESSWASTKSEQIPPPPPPHLIKPAPSRPAPLRAPTRTSLEEALLPREELPEMEAQGAVSSEVPPQKGNEDDEDELNAPGPRISTPNKTVSKLPLPRNPDPAPQQSPLTMSTIVAKLAASERDADAARVRAKLKAARGTRGVKRPAPANGPSGQATTSVPTEPASRENVDPVKRDPRPGQDEEQEIRLEKRKRERRTSKVTSRRRSTLSPWELESLMSGNV